VNNNKHPEPDGTGPSSGTPIPHDAAHGLPATGNPYSAYYQQAAAQPDLDAAAPALGSNELRRMNRRALGFLAGLLLVLAIAAIWIFSGLLRPKETSRKPNDEVVVIPEAPKPHLPPPPPSSTPRQAEAIALAPSPPSPVKLPELPSPPKVQGPHQPTLVERRIADSTRGVTMADSPPQSHPPGAAPLPGQLGPMGGDTGVPANSAYATKPLSPTSGAQPLIRPDTLMLRGTYIRCILETHIVTDVPGFTSCVVTEPVYSFSGKRLLLPKGSKVLGKYDTEPNGPRVAVIWDRIVTPTGIDMNMASPGIDNLGGAGHPGDYDEHWGSRIGAAMLISLFSDAFKYAAAEHGPTSSTVGNGGVVVQSPYESNTAQTLQSFANQAVRRAANRPATVTIHQGTVVNVYVARDVDFSGVVARY
jgi:type IV secretion system protein VirB10